MKLFFSEAKSDYGHYLYPYVIWAAPEPGEAPADLFNAGFLPSARGFNYFVACRNVRVDLAKFKSSSENRRILRKGGGIEMKLVPRAEFDLNDTRREAYKNFADARFGRDVMPHERLELTFNSPVCTHLLVFSDARTGAERGVAVLYLEPPRLAFYRFAFYDLNHFNRSLGLFMMTSAVEFFAGEKIVHLYLGTCYSEKALYKTQFAGVEFFNGFKWSQDLHELKFLLKRDALEPNRHLLENPDYRAEFLDGAVTPAGGFKAKLR